MKTRFPYPGIYQISQGYASNPINPVTGEHYYTQHHGGWDIVPLNKPGGNFWPAPIFPVVDGKTVSVSTTDVNRGLGIGVETVLDQDLINYFKSKGCIPQGYNDPVKMHTLYWHCLKVTDLDGQVDENTQVGLTGNSGNVFAGGLPVPDSQKNKPNYPGGHLHFEYYLFGNVRFNLDKDASGRLDPDILFNYKGNDMSNVIFAHKAGTEEYGFWVPATTAESAKDKALNFGLTITKPDGSVDFGQAKEINGL